MSDRELLELAAKAADIACVYDTDFDMLVLLDSEVVPTMWNPLKDDGDALRLAVKTGEPFVVRSRCVTTMGGLMEDFDPAVSGDDLRATRRAIVSAAAAIGKAMP